MMEATVDDLLHMIGELTVQLRIAERTIENLQEEVDEAKRDKPPIDISPAS